MSAPCYIDTHAHVQLADFDLDRSEVIARWQSAGVCLVIVPGVDIPTSALAVQLARTTPGIRAAIGVHPDDCTDAVPDFVDHLSKLAEDCGETIVAIGEIGLDFKDGMPDHRQQETVFRRQLELALALGLPVIVHSRFATGACLDALCAYPGIRGVMHCFGGSVDELARAVDMGLYVSFTGSVTFPAANNARAALQACPVEHLLLETDAPYLAPIPLRGRRNEPAFIGHVYHAASLLKGVQEEVLCRQLQHNAAALFTETGRETHARQENVQDCPRTEVV